MPSTRQWVLTDIADSTQLGTRERVIAKVGKIQATRTVAATGDGRREKSDRRAMRTAREFSNEAEIVERTGMESCELDGRDWEVW